MAIHRPAQPPNALSCTSRTELRVAQFAAGRDRLVTAAELRAAGVSSWTATRWLKRGRLRRVHRGVYLYGGGECSQEGTFRAALLAIGDDAVLSHVSAAVAHRIWPYAVPARVDVTVPRPLRSRKGIRVHSVAELPPSAITTVDGIPVTTPARTAVDLAATVRRDYAYRRAVHEAQVQGKLDFAAFAAEAERAPTNLKGKQRLLVELDAGPTRTRSGFEDWGADLLRGRGFPPFELNGHPPGAPRWVEVDIYFPAQRLVVELDGDRYHNTPWRRQQCAEKRGILKGLDYPVLVLTDADAKDEQRAAERIWDALRRCR
jgi:hypothetical protein